ncbi:MAG: sulfatase-like hydrolase/transferase, partial [Halanaerobiaceae bacterium]
MNNNNIKRPNFLIILADDMGFSDAGCYGGEINTDNLDKLAENGLRFTQFYNTARCWPSRSCIMTGYYAQQVRMDPRYGDSLPSWTSLMPHYLNPLGYRCYHSGKWHIMNAPMPVRDGGFDKSYMLNDHNRFFAPKKHREDDQPLPPVKEGVDYYATTAFADHAIKCLQEHEQEHADQPFFEYLAFTSPHFPLHAPQEDIDKYRGEYDEGWDVIRKRRWQKLQDMGIVSCNLPPLEPEVIPGWNLPPEELKEKIGSGEAARAIPWDELTEEQQNFQAEKMAIHAAMIDRMVQEIGRVIDQVKDMGEFENTVIMFMSDNGASAEQINRGDEHDPSAAPGSGDTFLCLGPGWSTSS